MTVAGIGGDLAAGGLKTLNILRRASWIMLVKCVTAMIRTAAAKAVLGSEPTKTEVEELGHKLLVGDAAGVGKVAYAFFQYERVRQMGFADMRVFQRVGVFLNWRNKPWP
jgi:hypothetical protein